MLTITGKTREVQTRLQQASQEELASLLASLIIELNKLYLVHSLGKLEQSSLIKKNRRAIATVRTLLRKKYNVHST